MLNGIHLVNFCNHRDTRLTFGRMTALVGQNGAGKTNAMRAVLEIAKRYADEDIRPTDVSKVLRSGSKEWILETSWPGPLNKKLGCWAERIDSHGSIAWLWRKAALNGDTSWLPVQADWTKAPVWDDNPSMIEADKVAKELDPGTVIKPFQQQPSKYAWTSRYFKTSGSFLQGPSYSESVPPSLGENCRDLAWMIAYLKGDKEEIFNDITQALRQVVPTFKRVRHRPKSVMRLEKKEVVINNQTQFYDDRQQVMGQELRFDMASGNDLPASSISEGTLISLAILTAVIYEAREGQQTILLDDVESGLHPSAQRDLVRQLRRLQKDRPELQIIFSSHSPYIIDEMQPEDVWLFAPDEEGIAHCAKLSDHPDAKRALEVLTTGEFWSAEGESWVLDRAKQSSVEAVAAK